MLDVYYRPISSTDGGDMAFDSFHQVKSAAPEGAGLDAARAEAYGGAASAHLELVRANGTLEPPGKNPKPGSGSSDTDTNTDKNTDTNTNTNRGTNTDTNRVTDTVATNVRTTVVDTSALGGLAGGVDAGHANRARGGRSSCDWGGGANFLGVAGVDIHGPSKECKEIEQRPEILNWTLQANREASETMRTAGETAMQATGAGSDAKARVLLDVANEQRKLAETLGAGAAAGLTKVFPEQMKQQTLPGAWTSDILKNSSNQ
jgi:hypothetical protein